MLHSLALWICVCNDLNSFFQCLLSGTMWGLNRYACFFLAFFSPQLAPDSVFQV